MRYTEKTSVKYLREKYDCIIGWGAGGEFKKYYRGEFLDYVVDSGEKGKIRLGKEINGLKVLGIDEIKNKINMKDTILIVIYPNIEQEILNSVYTVFSENIDTIIARLLDYGDKERTYSTNKEDNLMIQAIEKMQFKNFSYMDVGVCHPVVRNNTYLFYEMGYFNGVLVEPNVEMCSLASVYRPQNKVVNCGASCEIDENKKQELMYYYDNNNLGLNTFSKEVAERRGMLSSAIKVQIKNINKIIAENFESYPNVLDIDTEGMDYEILETIDFKKYPINIICAETNGDARFSKLLSKYQYKVYAETKENTIFVKNDIF